MAKDTAIESSEAGAFNDSIAWNCNDFISIDNYFHEINLSESAKTKNSAKSDRNFQQIIIPNNYSSLSYHLIPDLRENNQHKQLIMFCNIFKNFINIKNISTLKQYTRFV